MTRPFRDALIEALDATGWTLKRVAEESGVSEEQLKKVRQGKSRSTNVDDALKVAHVFGVTLDEFLGDDTSAVRSEAAQLWMQLSQEERDILLAAARGRAVLPPGAAR
ncbi:helix-turn-helix transcriptional regulator [Falsirhodobacter halotolerans]|uniref:helix-turn-helix transcriptional regulator n=1 Tax=Falsirhodobacter halotolerans TaxID=1146892 RepID=UPI003CC7FE0D